MQNLFVRYESSLVGMLERNANGILIFTYDAGWCADARSFPLSLAMLVKLEPYRGEVVRSFFDNLIPEGEARKSIERVAGLPEGDDGAYLERFGVECAGALSIAPQVASQPSKPSDSAERDIAFAAIEQAIADGTPVQSVLIVDGELPPFSLAGAQAKFPCIVRDGLVVLPRSGAPTTHIIKLPIRAGDKLLDSVHNEYLSMRLAEACGLPVPAVALIGDKIPLFSIERFDRIAKPEGTGRLHTQDFCQALGRTSAYKYERHGGPTFADCYGVVGNNSENPAHDLMAMLDWLGFNLGLGNNDSHAKNLSLMQSGDGLVLSPFYDLVCTAIYKQYNAEFAFNVGGVTNWQKIRAASVETLARQLGIKVPFIKTRWHQMFDRLDVAAKAMGQQILPPETARTLRKITDQIDMRLKMLRRYL